jgi:hypothetical protein
MSILWYLRASRRCLAGQFASIPGCNIVGLELGDIWPQKKRIPHRLGARGYLEWPGSCTGDIYQVGYSVNS